MTFGRDFKLLFVGPHGVVRSLLGGLGRRQPQESGEGSGGAAPPRGRANSKLLVFFVAKGQVRKSFKELVTSQDSSGTPIPWSGERYTRAPGKLEKGHAWTGGYSTLFSEIGFWIGPGEVWASKLAQSLSNTYLGGPLDRFDIGFEQVFWSKLPQTKSKTRSRTHIEYFTCP